MACNDMCKHGVYKPDPETGMPKVVYGMGCVQSRHGCERNCPMEAIHYFGNDGTPGIDYNNHDKAGNRTAFLLPAIAILFPCLVFCGDLHHNFIHFIAHAFSGILAPLHTA